MAKKKVKDISIEVGKAVEEKPEVKKEVEKVEKKEGNKVVVGTENLMIRTEANTYVAKMVGYLKEGDQVEVLEDKDQFCKIKAINRKTGFTCEGYVMSQFIG